MAWVLGKVENHVKRNGKKSAKSICFSFKFKCETHFFHPFIKGLLNKYAPQRLSYISNEFKKCLYKTVFSSLIPCIARHFNK